MNENQNNGAMLAALGYPVALPQTVVPVTNTKYSVQRIQYDPQKMAALKLALATKRDMQPLKDALAKPRPVVSAGEAIANALAQYPEARSYTGGFGEEIISPWAEGLSGFARGFGTAYGARKASEREAAQQAREDAIKAAQLDVEAAEKAREDAIKAAQLDLDASKQVIASETDNTHMKFNDPNSKAYAEMREQAKNNNVINMLENNLEDIGRRFDEDFKDIDDMQANSTRLGRSSIGGLYGAGVTKDEKLARDEFDAWKGSVKNVLVNANRQAGSGSMSDADAARYEQNIGQTKTPAEARVILRSFVNRMNAGQGQVQAPLSNDINAIWDMIK